MIYLLIQLTCFVSSPSKKIAAAISISTSCTRYFKYVSSQSFFKLFSQGLLHRINMLCEAFLCIRPTKIRLVPYLYISFLHFTIKKFIGGLFFMFLLGSSISENSTSPYFPNSCFMESVS
jgi:hypothetical protein